MRRLDRLVANQQHGDRRHADDLLGIAADHQPAHAAAAVRADDDQVRAPPPRLVDDDVGNRPRDRLRQLGLDRNAARLDPRPCGSDDPGARLPERAEHVGGAELEAGREVLVEHVDDADPTAREAGDADRFVETADRGRAAVDGNEDLSQYMDTANPAG